MTQSSPGTSSRGCWVFASCLRLVTCYSGIVNVVCPCLPSPEVNSNRTVAEVLAPPPQRSEFTTDEGYQAAMISYLSYQRAHLNQLEERNIRLEASLDRESQSSSLKMIFLRFPKTISILYKIFVICLFL